MTDTKEPAGTSGAVEPDWHNADTCIENMQIAYDDALEFDPFDDGNPIPIDTVVNAGDLGVLIDLARYAVATRPPAHPVDVPGWRCFHCDDYFTDEHCARLHFGRQQDSDPACQIKAGAEQGLLGALRAAEYEAADARQAIADECTDAARAHYAQASRFDRALRDAEEAGYERGLADGRSFPNPDASPQADTTGASPCLNPPLAPDTKALTNLAEGGGMTDAPMFRAAIEAIDLGFRIYGERSEARQKEMMGALVSRLPSPAPLADDGGDGAAHDPGDRERVVREALADLVKRVREHVEHDVRGRTHDGTNAGTAYWWVRLRYDDVIALCDAVKYSDCVAREG